MYGLSDHLKPIPLTGFSAVLQGSSRYSTPTGDIIEQTFASAAETASPFPILAGGQLDDDIPPSTDAPGVGA